MKTRIILTLAVSAMIFLGCSKDSLVDPIDEFKAVEMNRPDFDSKAVKKTSPFHIKGIGEFEAVKPTECNFEGQINVMAESKEARLGKFKTMWRNCTDFRNSNFLKGMHISENGDELYFYSEESGIDDLGNFYVIIYYGGTGHFSNAVGKMKFYYQEKWISNYKGTINFEGQGTLSY